LKAMSQFMDEIKTHTKFDSWNFNTLNRQNSNIIIIGLLYACLNQDPLYYLMVSKLSPNQIY